MKSAGLKGAKTSAFKFSVRFVLCDGKIANPDHVLCVSMVAARVRADVCYSGRAWGV
jgi:hypothetical protein